MAALDGRVALVTGSARGIGAEIARRFAGEGACVGVLDLDDGGARATVDEIRGDGGRALALTADVAEPDQVDRAVRQLVETFGAVDVLVNNAGVTRDNLLYRMSDDDWDTVIRVHLRGAFVVTRAVQRYMVERRYGRIINLSSTSALGNRGHANYASAKAGLQGFTRTLAIELGPYGVTANAIAPGFVETRMTEAVAARAGQTMDELKASVAAGLPVRRVGRPADIAHAALFFAAEEAGYVTGQVLYVDGGHAVR